MGSGPFNRGFSFERALFWAYAVFLAGFFFFPQAPEHYKYFYIFIVIPLLFRYRLLILQLKNNLLVLLVVMYTVYMVSSSFWSASFGWHDFSIIVWHGFLVLLFVAGTGYVQKIDPEKFESILRYLVVIAAITALISIFAWYKGNPFPQSQLRPISRMNHEVLAGCAYGFFAVLSLYFLQIETVKTNRIYWFLTATVLILTVLFTQSRTALMALSVAFFAFSTDRYKLLGSIAIFLLSVTFVLLLEPVYWHRIARGFSHRPEIWLETINLVNGSYMFGKGYLSDTRVYVDGIAEQHAHSAYIATFRDGGLVGILLLAGIVIVSMIYALRMDKEKSPRFYSTLLVYGIICAIPDLDRLLTRPKEHWLFFWLPVALVAAVYNQTSSKTGRLQN